MHSPNQISDDEAEKIEADFRIISVTKGENIGIWCNGGISRLRGNKGDPIHPRLRTLSEKLAGRRANMKFVMAQRGTEEAYDLNLKEATPQLWAKLLMICVAGIDGYTIEDI